MAEYKGSITLVNINDGETGQDSSRFWIETNQNEIYKFYEETSIQPTLSPEKLVFAVYDAANSELVPLPSEFPIDINDISWIKSLKIGALQVGESDEENDTVEFPLPTLNEEELEYEETSLNNNYIKRTRDYYTIADNQITFNLQKFIKFWEELDSYTFVNSDIQSEQKVANILKNRETAIRIRVNLKVGTSNFLAQRYLTVSYGMRDAMAKLALKAEGIYASIQSTALDFTANGLAVRNGGISIYKSEYSQVDETLTEEKFNNGTYYFQDIDGYKKALNYEPNTIYYTKEDIRGFYADNFGNLRLEGIIHADGGEIGGFLIEKDKLSSKNGELVLNGVEGTAILGKSFLKDRLLLGEQLDEQNDLYQVMMLSPTNEKPSFLQVYKKDKNENVIKTIDFSSDGFITLGASSNKDYQITLDGNNSIIKGFNWSISPNLARFSNVNVSGTIDCMVFNKSSVSAVGGMLFVRPSDKILKVEPIEGSTIKYKIILEQGFIGIKSQEQGYCRIDRPISSSGQNGTIYAYLTSIDETTFETDTDLSDWEGAIVTNFNSGEIGIGINGSYSNNFLPSYAISVLQMQEGGALPEPKVILGKLPDDSSYFGELANSYGLYAENVFLNGILTTKTKSEEEISTYSGIGTTLKETGAPTTQGKDEYFPEAAKEGKLGQILIWAGSKGTTPNEIEDSPFFVDKYGNMYAGSAYFEGTVITKSTIQASEIQTAIITGIGENDTALTIQNAANGIVFKSTERINNKDVENEVFKLSNTLLKAQLPFEVSNNIKISYKEGNFGYIVSKLSGEQEKIGSRLGFDSLTYEGKEILSYSDINNLKVANNFEVNNNGVTVKGSIFYNNGEEKKGEYRQVNGGYDLYIY